MNNNFIYKHLDTSDMDIEQIQKEIIAYHKFRNFPNVNFLTMQPADILPNLPTLATWFEKQGLVVDRCAHLGQRPQSQQALHIDTGNNSIALNFPIEVVEEAYTLFYKFKGKLVDRYTPNTNVRYQEYVDDALEELGRYVLKAPTLINIKLPHSIVNKSDTIRYCFSFRFKEDPWHLTY